MSELYENIKKFRKERHWSQEELSSKMGYSGKSMISQIERGKVDLTQSRIQQFANVFGITPDELMGRIESTAKQNASPTAIKVGQQLVGLEHKFGYSEQFVADSMGISLEHYHDMKNGINHILDPNLMCKFAAFYNKKWTDFFSYDGEPVEPADNFVALQDMAGLSDSEVCESVGLTMNEYDLIRMGEKSPDYSTIEKFCNLYNMPFAMLLGANLMAHADEPRKRLSVKVQVYINELYDALDGEEFDKDDMQELIDYIRFMAKNKKVKRMKEGK